MPDTEKKRKQIAASHAILDMITFIKKHPEGFKEDDVLQLIKTWMLVGKNFGGFPGDPSYVHGKLVVHHDYAYHMKKYFLEDFDVTADRPIPENQDDPDSKLKPSQRLYRKLNDLMNQVYNDNDVQRDSFFQQTEYTLRDMVYGFRIKLAQDDPDRAKRFRHSLAVLAHQLK